MVKKIVVGYLIAWEGLAVDEYDSRIEISIDSVNSPPTPKFLDSNPA